MLKRKHHRYLQIVKIEIRNRKGTERIRYFIISRDTEFNGFEWFEFVFILIPLLRLTRNTSAQVPNFANNLKQQKKRNSAIMIFSKQE
jgi:predicted glycosyl hydrolase (DUF1957 family)